jgi:hypothetical protein
MDTSRNISEINIHGSESEPLNGQLIHQIQELNWLTEQGTWDPPPDKDTDYRSCESYFRDDQDLRLLKVNIVTSPYYPFDLTTQDNTVHKVYARVDRSDIALSPNDRKNPELNLLPTANAFLDINGQWSYLDPDTQTYVKLPDNVRPDFINDIFDHPGEFFPPDITTVKPRPPKTYSTNHRITNGIGELHLKKQPIPESIADPAIENKPVTFLKKLLFFGRRPT